jgi:hypothetical protein
LFSGRPLFLFIFFSKEFENLRKGYNFATPKSETNGFHGCVEMLNGGVPEWPNGADCKSAGVRLRWFESIRPHSLCQILFLKYQSGAGKNNAEVAQLVER